MVLDVIKNLFDLVFFVGVSYFAFYIPGSFLFHSLGFKKVTQETVAIYSMVGLMIFALSYYALSWIYLQNIFLLVVLGIDIYAVKKYGFTIPKIEKSHRASVLFVLLLAIIFSLALTVTGIYGNTISYRHEDLLHIAYIRDMMVHFPPQHPGFAGVPLVGYHFLSDFIMSGVAKTFYIPVETVFFHMFPLFTSIMWALSVYFFMYKWVQKKAAGVWAVFLSMFGGSFGFILLLQGHKSVNLDSVFGIAQPVSSLFNSQFALTVPLIVVVLTLLLDYFQKRNHKLLVPVVLCVGLIPMLKAYGGIVMYAGFSFFILTELIRKRFVSLIYFFTALGISLLTFGVFIGKGQGLLWYPLWPPRTVMLDNLPWYKYGEKSYTYYREGVIRKIIEIEAFGLMLYFIGNIGTRFVGILLVVMFNIRRKSPSLIFLTLLVMTITSITIPLFFIQRGKVFETIQFAWYYPVFCSFFAAIGFSHFFSLNFPKIVKGLLIAVIVVFTLPSMYAFTTQHTIPKLFQRELLNNSFHTTMKYLKSVGSFDDTVLELPPDGTIPTYASMERWYTNGYPYITAYANKRMYISYELIPYDNVNPRERLTFLARVAAVQQNPLQPKITLEKLKTSIKKRGIKYVYSSYKLRVNKDIGLKLEYQNEDNYIYKVQ